MISSLIDHMPLRRKLTVIIVGICAFVLFAACLSLAVFEVIDFRKAMVRDATVLADVLGRNSQAAIEFQDLDAGRSLLRALQAEPHVVAARIYGRRGTPFADYIRDGMTVSLPDRAGAEGTNFDSGSLLLMHPISLDGKQIGSIFVRLDLDDMYHRLGVFSGIAGLVLIGSSLIALVLSDRLQRPISTPILALAEVARQVGERQDYSLRVNARGKDEIGSLTDAFNQMLTRIHGDITERKNAEARVQAQIGRLDLLNRITLAIGERQDLASIFQVVIRSLEDDLAIDFCCVCLYDASSQILTVASVGKRCEALATELSLQVKAEVPIDQDGLAKCVAGQLVYEPDIGEIAFPFPQRLARVGLRALVAVPLVVESQVFGLLVAARNVAHSFSSAECEFLNQLCNQVALAAHQTQLYEALQKAYNDLRQSQQSIMQQERLRALGQMASGIAHDINNAISPIALYTDSMLETEKGLSERSRGYIETIKRAIEDVAHTVARMREFYRHRETQLILMPVDANQMVEQVLDLTRARWHDIPEQRGVVIKTVTDLASDLQPILGIASEIREALINLVFNAVDALPNGGTLTVRTLLSTNGPNDTGPAKAPFVLIEVIDNGVGMDEETRRRCLEPFFTTKGERGTGLGLAMVYGVLQRHGSKIEIISEIGHGTTMRLSFPIADVEIPGSTVSVRFQMPSRLRLLVIDDDPILLKSLRDILENDGHVVTTANNGQEGIDAFHASLGGSEPFGLVITDLGMPHVDGRQVASTVKQESPGTPVILLTGWGQRLVTEGEVPTHVDRVLNKPPNLVELRRALAECTNNSASVGNG